MFKKLTIWDNLANIYPFWNKYTEPLPVDEANLTKWKQLWIWRNIYIETHNGNTILQTFLKNTHKTLWTPLQFLCDWDYKRIHLYTNFQHCGLRWNKS